jgi:uncharacterized protein YjiS (DUF1127 family)
MPPAIRLAAACRRHGADYSLRRLRAVWLAAKLLHLADALARAWAMRRVVRELESWPDERLKDVGLKRGDVINAVRGLRRPFRWQPEADRAKLDRERFGH